ncbi:hypothetical protein A1507_06295 [Methylomonas koyamae]|uniref:Uncharacterized protein n=1 Tax=Methylomonas koyamae TaxID=702114 RepID=A0A177NRB8_9GAMM|nr:hypothetical protein A1507_06295 [Methylomonas koyamae]
MSFGPVEYGGDPGRSMLQDKRNLVKRNAGGLWVFRWRWVRFCRLGFWDLGLQFAGWGVSLVSLSRREKTPPRNSNRS